MTVTLKNGDVYVQYNGRTYSHKEFNDIRTVNRRALNIYYLKGSLKQESFYSLLEEYPIMFDTEHFLEVEEEFKEVMDTEAVLSKSFWEEQYNFTPKTLTDNYWVIGTTRQNNKRAPLRISDGFVHGVKDVYTLKRMKNMKGILAYLCAGEEPPFYGLLKVLYEEIEELFYHVALSVIEKETVGEQQKLVRVLETLDETVSFETLQLFTECDMYELEEFLPKTAIALT